MQRQLTPIVYILASQTRGTLYIGVTGYPMERMHQHREAAIPGFTADNGVKRLIYIEYFASMPEAIAREKQLKRWHRPWKINLIEQDNPTWRDLARDLGFGPIAPKRPLNVDAETSLAWRSGRIGRAIPKTKRPRSLAEPRPFDSPRCVWCQATSEIASSPPSGSRST